MSITLTKNTVTKIRPEQHVIFREITDYSNNITFMWIDEQRIACGQKAADPIIIQYQKWSLQLGYIMYNFDITTKQEYDFDISHHTDIKILYSDATLNRLTKMTGYNYLCDGQYTLASVYYRDKSYYVPKHWTFDLPDKSRRPDYYTVRTSFDEHYQKHKDDIDVEYICGIGIPLTQSIMKIADIDIVIISC